MTKLAPPCPPKRLRLRLCCFGLLTSLLLGGCATPPGNHNAMTDPSTEPSEADGTPQAAAPQSSKTDQQLDWAAIGGEFEKALGDAQVPVQRLPGGGLRIQVPASLSFDRDSTAIRPEFRTTLGKLAQVLLAHKDLKLTIIGHTDSLGRELYNLKLSFDRADAVSQLLQQAGLPFTRISTLGKGESEPIADNATEAGRAANRRVEFQIHATSGTR